MKQNKFPCCKKSMGLDDVFAMISYSNGDFGSSSKDVECPHCGKGLIVYLDVDSVEVAD